VTRHSNYRETISSSNLFGVGIYDHVPAPAGAYQAIVGMEDIRFTGKA
jgi:hypothetical protein